MKRLLVLSLLAILASACNYAKEQGTVSVEVTAGKVVKIHEPGDTYSTFGAYTTAYEVDIRQHMDGVDIQGVTKDNAPFYMKIDIVYRPIHYVGASPDQDPLTKYIQAFGLDDAGRASRRWGVLSQLVKNAARDAASGKYDAYELRASQAKVLTDIQQELTEKFKNELYCEISSVGMEIQPQFSDPKIDEAANNVVAAKKQKDAEQAWKDAAQTRLEKQQIENAVWQSSPQAYELKKMEWQWATTKELAQGIANFRGQTLIIDPAALRQLQLQSPLGGK